MRNELTNPLRAHHEPWRTDSAWMQMVINNAPCCPRSTFKKNAQTIQTRLQQQILLTAKSMKFRKTKQYFYEITYQVQNKEGGWESNKILKLKLSVCSLYETALSLCAGLFYNLLKFVEIMLLCYRNREF